MSSRSASGAKTRPIVARSRGLGRHRSPTREEASQAVTVTLCGVRHTGGRIDVAPPRPPPRPPQRPGRRPSRPAWTHRSPRTAGAPDPSPTHFGFHQAGCPLRGGQKIQKSDARARRQQSTVLVVALRPMLTYRLTGTIKETGSTGADPPILHAPTALQPAINRPRPANQCSRATVSPEGLQAADLRFLGGAEGIRTPDPLHAMGPRASMCPTAVDLQIV